MRRIALAWLAAILFLVVSAMATAAVFPLKYTDQTGHTVTLNAPAKRVVSLAPSHTEILFALGAGNKLVGVDSYSNYPAAAASKTVVGSLNSISLEKLAALKPDLVLLYELNAKHLQAQLASLGIPSIVFVPESLNETYDTILDIGMLVGAEEQAKQLVADMRRKAEKVKSVVAKAKSKPRVFYEVWPDPLYTAGPGSFIDELITLSGGVNIAADAAGKWPVYSLEALVTRNPDVIITPFAPAESIAGGYKTPLLASIKALATGRVHRVDPDAANRPGPRLVDALEEFAKAIHPELF